MVKLNDDHWHATPEHSDKLPPVSDNRVSSTMDERMHDQNGDGAPGGGDYDYDYEPVVTLERDTASAGTKKLRKQNEAIQRLAQEAKDSNSVLLDLSKKGLKKIPEEVLELTQLQYLYLEGNEITCLPDEFFDRLENLQWLDLRHNYLTVLPSVFIGRHRCLRTLLLQDNELRTLPLELGLIETLNGISLHNNPLEFPPSEIITQGTQGILQFFRDLLGAKSGRSERTVPQLEELRLADRDDNKSAGSEDSSPVLPSSPSPPPPGGARNHAYNIEPSRTSHSMRSEDHSDLRLMGPQSASMYRPIQYSDRKRHAPRLRPDSDLRVDSTELKRHLVKKSDMTVDLYPAPPPPERIVRKAEQIQNMARLRHDNERTDGILQKRRDVAAIKEWRDDAKKLQQVKHRERMYKGFIDFTDATDQAPFGIEPQLKKMVTKEEKIKEDVKAKHEKIRKQPLDPEARLQLEQSRAQRDRELAKRIRDHTSTIKDRRKNPQPNPQEAIKAAQRDLELAEEQHKEVIERQKALEYRFRAFTGDADSPTTLYKK